MNFQHLSYLPYLILGFLVFAGLLIFYEHKFFRTIKTYWFYRRSLLSVISSTLFLIGVGGLLLSLLDSRGPEERIKTPVPKQRTIILIDTSASMLAEDVKPNRLQKAVLIAKHFARKAVGQQLSVVAFAEIQKPIVPFTNDLDLIDARLDSLKFLHNLYGSSALSVAIQESLQYFYDGGGEMRGNLLVFTDGEETSSGVRLKIPEGIRVAFVGVGTSQGGKIPMDDGRGLRFGYKKERGKDVITKLNESFFKATVADVPSARYWLANSYSLPSEEILAFFRSEDRKASENQDMVIRPVTMEWIVLPSLALLVLAWLLKSLRVFTLGLVLFLTPVRAQEEEKVELSPEVMTKLENLQEGKLDRRQRVKLADELYKAGAKEDGLSLFSENLPAGKVAGDVPPEAYLNYGTALLESGKSQEGLQVYDQLNRSLGDDAESRKLKSMMATNALTHFRQMQEKKKQQDKKNKENQDQQQKDQQNQNGQGQSGDQQQKQSGQDKKKDQKEQNKGDEKKDEKKDKGDESKDEQKKENGDEQKPEGEKKPLPPKKLAPKLKQLMFDDRQLQMKKIEQDTRDLNRRRQRNSKDW